MSNSGNVIRFKKNLFNLRKKGRSEPKLDKKSLRTHQNVQLASRKDSPESSGEDEPISKKHGNGKPKKVKSHSVQMFVSCKI